MAKTIEEFISETEFAGAVINRLAGDASTRRYARVTLVGKTAMAKSAMVMDTPTSGENFHAFVQIAESLVSAGYSAPKILARDMENGFLLLEDFGDDSFTKILANNITSETELYETAIDLLVDWQKIPAMPLPAYNLETYLREVSLFPDWFLLKVFGAEKEADLRAEYMQIWSDILQSAQLCENIFVHRDFHADNLMWLPQRNGVQRVGLLDFQDGLIGDAAYDMVSLLEDARRDVPPQLATKMIERYLQKTGKNKADFLAAYNVLGAQRNSKIIGIFTRLAVRDGKQNYLQFMPRVWNHLQRDLQHPQLSTLRNWLDKHVSAELRR